MSNLSSSMTAPLVGLALAIGLALPGCTSPWSTKTSTKSLTIARDGASPAPAATPAASPATLPTGQIAGQSKDSAGLQPNANAMQSIMAELHALEASDPAMCNKLMDDLRQTDPSLWPLVMKQYRATAEYRRQAAEREPQVAGGPPAEAVPFSLTGSPFASPQGVASPCGAASVAPASRLPEPVVSASYNAPTSSVWRQRLNETIEAMERELPTNPTTPADMAQYARLRILNLAAGRNIDALRLLPTASPAAQQFWANEMGGLSTWLDVEDIPDEGRRAAETKTMLANALTRLSETAPLVIRNASFCTAIQSYGCVKRFEKNEFTANQDVLIYAEVENFITEPGLNGFRSSLKSSYRIFDAAGQCAAEQEFAPSEEYCQNARRDFFLGYRTRLSKDIKPGRYQLQLTIEDLIAHKIGQTSIEFAIKETGADSANSPAPGPGKP